MIKEIKMFTVICDRCGDDANEGNEVVAWESKESAEYVAKEDGWIELNGKHYCEDCKDGKIVVDPIVDNEVNHIPSEQMFTNFGIFMPYNLKKK